MTILLAIQILASIAVLVPIVLLAFVTFVSLIERGKDPNRPLLSGMFGSFGDAPDGFSEEMHLILI